MEVLVKNIYHADTISRDNVKAWEKLGKFMDEFEGDKHITLDFKGIEVKEIWESEEFKRFMQRYPVTIKLWDNEIAVNTINLMGEMDNIKGLAVNIATLVNKPNLKNAAKINTVSEDLVNNHYTNNPEGCPMIRVDNKLSQIQVRTGVKYLREAVKKCVKREGIEKIILETGKIDVNSDIIEDIATMIDDFGKQGVEVIFNNTHTDILDKIEIYHRLAEVNIKTDEERLEKLKEVLTPGKPGLLMRYRESSSVDNFGRKGNGDVVSCRVAIYLRREEGEDKETKFVFRTYNGDTFYTKEHWALEHDGEELDKLDCRDEYIPQDQLGIYGLFFGSKYHFAAPLQDDINQNVTIYSGNGKGKSLTIPERMKVVFDDWDIQYDVKALDEYIKEVNDILYN